jgi:ribosome-binding ATPase
VPGLGIQTRRAGVCSKPDDIVHSMGGVEPILDIEVINTELVLADIASLDKRLDKARKKARSLDTEAQAEVALLEKILPHLNEGKPASLLQLSDDEAALLSFFLLSAKPVLYAANAAESDLANALENEHVAKVAVYARERVNTHTKFDVVAPEPAALIES